QEYARRAGLQEQRVGVNLLATGFLRRSHQGIERCGRIRDSGQHRRADDAGIHARGAQLANGSQPQVGTRGARLQYPRQLRVQRRDRQVYEECVVRGDLLQQLDIAQHQIGLGDDAEPQAVVQRQLFQNAARDLVAPFSRLIGIGRRAQRDLLAVLDLLQLLSQQPRRLLLDVNLALEVDAIAHLHELVRVARITIFAAELAASVGVDGPRERHARGSAAIEQRARRKGEVLYQVPLPDRLAFRGKLRDPDQLRRPTFAL